MKSTPNNSQKGLEGVERPSEPPPLEETVKSKKSKSPKKTKLRSKTNQFLFEYNGTKIYKPGPKLSKEINERADLIEAGKIKTTRWKGSIEKTFGEKE